MDDRDNQEAIGAVRDTSIHVIPRQECCDNADGSSSSCETNVRHAGAIALRENVCNAQQKEGDPDGKEEEVERECRLHGEKPELDARVSVC